jgi:hypothetical protein
VSTGVDALVRLVEKHPMISLDEAAKQLQTKLAILQNWVDFLVEEHILGIEYKFITPYLYLIKEKKDALLEKDAFFVQQKLHPQKDFDAWRTYFVENKDKFKHVFMSKAQQRGLGEDTIDKLWFMYEQKMLEVPK